MISLKNLHDHMVYLCHNVHIKIFIKVYNKDQNTKFLYAQKYILCGIKVTAYRKIYSYLIWDFKY